MNYGIYPRPDLIVDERYHYLLKCIKECIKNFKLSHKIFGNLEKYENSTYLDNKNSTLYSLIWGVDERKIALLENSLKLCCKKFSKKKYKAFCIRVSSLDHNESKSAFDEIVAMYKIANSIGIENVTYEPKVQNDKNCDIGIIYKNSEIYLELTFIRSVNIINDKINHICNKAAKYMYDKIDNRVNIRIILELDTQKLCFDKNSYINVEQSIKKLYDHIDNLHTSVLSRQTHENKKSSIHNYCSIFSNILNTYEKKNNMMKIKISQPFVNIYTDNGEYFSVRINRSSYRFNSKFDEIDKNSFLNQVKNKIIEKLSTNQYKNGHPFIIMINVHVTSYDIDPIYCNHDSLKKIIFDTLLNYNFISGILIYDDDYYYGLYFKNNVANNNIKLNDETIKNLFSDFINGTLLII